MYLYRNNKKSLFMLMVLVSSGTLIWGMDFNNKKIGGQQKKFGRGGEVLPMPTVVPLEAVPVVQAQRVRPEVVQRGLVAPNGERFRCHFEGCGHVEKYASMLKIHVRTHTGEKPFQCGIDGCTYAAAKNGDLKKHKRTHTGEKPYVCGIDGCKFAAAQNGDLKKHKRTHTGEKPYVCEFDGCKFATVYLGNITKHRRTHTGAKPHVCGIDGCTYAAAQNGDLTKHVRTHTNGGSNKCDYEGCKCCFKTPRALTRHQKEHKQGKNISVAGKREREESTQDVSQDRNSKRSKKNQGLTKGVSEAVGSVGSSQQLEPRFAKVVPAETIGCVSLDDANSAEFDVLGNEALEGSDSYSDFDGSKCTGRLSCAMPEPRAIWDELECEPYAVSCIDADVEGESFGALDAGANAGANAGAVEVQGGDGDERWMEYVNFDGLSDSEKI